MSTLLTLGLVLNVAYRIDVGYHWFPVQSSLNHSVNTNQARLLLFSKQLERDFSSLLAECLLGKLDKVQTIIHPTFIEELIHFTDLISLGMRGKRKVKSVLGNTKDFLQHVIDQLMRKLTYAQQQKDSTSLRLDFFPPVVPEIAGNLFETCSR